MRCVFSITPFAPAVIAAVEKYNLTATSPVLLLVSNASALGPLHKNFAKQCGKKQITLDSKLKDPFEPMQIQTIRAAEDQAARSGSGSGTAGTAGTGGSVSGSSGSVK